MRRASSTAFRGTTTPHPCRSTATASTRSAVSIRSVLSLRRQFGFASSMHATIDATIGEANEVPSTNFVMLADNVAFLQFDRDQLAQQRRGQIACFVEIFIDAFMWNDDARQFIVRRRRRARRKDAPHPPSAFAEVSARQPRSRRDHFRFLQPIDRWSIRRAIHSAPRAIERVLIVETANRNRRRRTRRRQNRMPGASPALPTAQTTVTPALTVSSTILQSEFCKYDCSKSPPAEILATRISVLVPIRQHPTQTHFDMTFGNASGFSDLHQHSFASGAMLR